MKLDLLLSLALCLPLFAACEAEKPATLTTNPTKTIRFGKKGAVEKVFLTTKDKKGRPWLKPIKPTWSSADTKVATVNQSGEVTAVGTGQTEITANAEGLSASVAVEVSIVGSIEIKKEGVKTDLKLTGKGPTLEIVVKDDRGNVMEEHPTLQFRTSDYCVEVNPDFSVAPLSLGQCTVTAFIREVEGRLDFKVTQ